MIRSCLIALVSRQAILSPFTDMQNLRSFLARQRDQSLYRSRRVAQSPQSPRMQIDGQQLLTFCSNDYLGLANHPDVITALRKAANDYGVGSGAAHLINGHSHAHHALEEELADFVGRQRALLFSTGYMANIGAVTALMDRDDCIIADKFVHASLLDAAQLSRASLKRYTHADANALAERLHSSKARDCLVVTDGVFSMDGDLAPLPGIIAAIQKRNACLLVDDAHGLGVIGKTGRGILEHFSCNEQVDVLVGTLGKAFGSFGAFVAGSEELIETLVQKARSYIYTTAMPPAIAEATRTSLRLVRQADDRREKLSTLVARFRQAAVQLGLKLMDSATPIQPIVVGSAERAVSMSETLLRKGILVSAIRPPTVAEGSARLRITFSAAHTDADVDALLLALESLQ